MIVFKQSYRSRLSPGTAGLNVRHLQYIATRPGVVKNQGCGFGLWGSSYGAVPENILDFEGEKVRLRSVSERRTVYRAVLSAGKTDAEEKHLYDRAVWERMLEAQVGSIAKEMNIHREDFCWLASMHYAKGHPHVHLLYWDNGTDPRPEAVPAERFQIMAEHVRAAFSRELYGEEIQEQRNQQQEEQKSLREQVRALCLEANPEIGLNLQRISSGGTADEIGQGLVEILQELPAKGSLDYKYLPPKTKAAVDGLIDRCLEIPDLREAARRYCTSTNAISHLYGNGKETAEHNLSKAQSTLHRALANEIMDEIKALAAEIREDRPDSREALQAMALETAGNLRSGERYHELLLQMPRERIPHRVLRDLHPALAADMDAWVSEICQDFRVSARIQAVVEKELQEAGLSGVMKQGVEMKKAVFWDFRQGIADQIYLSLRQQADPAAAEAIQNTVTKAKLEPAYQELLGQIKSHLDLQALYYNQDPVWSKLIPWSQNWAAAQEQRLAVLSALRQDAGLEQVGQAELLAAIQASTEYAALLQEGRCQKPATFSGRKELLSEIMPQIQEAMDKDVRQALREDAGWNQEHARTGAETAVVSMLSVVSRMAAQQEAIEAQARRHRLVQSREKSKAAKRDERHRREMGSGSRSGPEME